MINFTLQSFGLGEIATIGGLENLFDNSAWYFRDDPGSSHIMFGTVCRAALDEFCSEEEFLIE
jgi:hypothetical protein